MHVEIDNFKYTVMAYLKAFCQKLIPALYTQMEVFMKLI
jgi:hypothetical protein